MKPSNKKDVNVLNKLFKMLLTSKGTTLMEMQQKLDMSKRTVRRYLNFIENNSGDMTLIRTMSRPAWYRLVKGILK